MELSQLSSIKGLPDFGKVAVIMGGASAEREISMQTGKAVVGSLKRSGVNVTALEVRNFSYQMISQMQHFDRAFIALHGPSGEDGELQGLLSSVGLPFTGSGVLGSALAMDKVKAKQIWSNLGLNTPKSWVLEGLLDVEQMIRRVDSGEIALPLMVKPVGEGSSLGMSKITEAGEAREALIQAHSFGGVVLVEPFLPGPEYTVGIIKNTVLPVIRINTQRAFYDYHAKYVDDNTEFLVPSGLDSEREKSMQDLALQAFRSLGCQGWGRVDLLQDGQGEFSLIEVNTVPGLTSHSLVPKACAAANVSFDQMILHILDTAGLPKKVQLNKRSEASLKEGQSI